MFEVLDFFTLHHLSWELLFCIFDPRLLQLNLFIYKVCSPEIKNPRQSRIFNANISSSCCNYRYMAFQTCASSTPNYYAIPLAPDTIRVQSCVWCLFWTNRNCMAVSSIFLSISSSSFKSPLYQINWLQHLALFFF